MFGLFYVPFETEKNIHFKSFRIFGIFFRWHFVGLPLPFVISGSSFQSTSCTAPIKYATDVMLGTTWINFHQIPYTRWSGVFRSHRLLWGRHSSILKIFQVVPTVCRHGVCALAHLIVRINPSLFVGWWLKNSRTLQAFKLLRKLDLFAWDGLRLGRWIQTCGEIYVTTLGIATPASCVQSCFVCLLRQSGGWLPPRGDN